jgi:hypothetical protein
MIRINKMIAATLIAFVFTLGCQPVENGSQANNGDQVESTRVDENPRNEERKFNVIMKYVDNLFGATYDMVEIEHDGCRYLIIQGYGETLQWMHKPNCLNPFH